MSYKNYDNAIFFGIIIKFCVIDTIFLLVKKTAHITLKKLNLSVNLLFTYIQTIFHIQDMTENNTSESYIIKDIISIPFAINTLRYMTYNIQHNPLTRSEHVIVQRRPTLNLMIRELQLNIMLLRNIPEVLQHPMGLLVH